MNFKSAWIAFFKFHKIIQKRIKIYQIDKNTSVSDNCKKKYLTILQKKINTWFLITSIQLNSSAKKQNACMPVQKLLLWISLFCMCDVFLFKKGQTEIGKIASKTSKNSIFFALQNCSKIKIALKKCSCSKNFASI
jgi:hypothetical protein